MTNIHIVIPVANSGIQNFYSLVNDLRGNYVAEDHVKETYVDGELVEEIIENPYKNSPAPDFSGKITLVSHEAINALSGTDVVIVDGELDLPKLWNSGISHAASKGASHIVILNEVSSINPHIFEVAVSKNNSELINISDGGCFIVKPTVSANESYRWWFADLDLFNRYDMAFYREDFIDIKQENVIPIDETMKAIVEADSAIYSQ